MKISSLSTENYRNLESSTMIFGDDVNFIYGKNAQGKTNLIEAIWMFTGARSFRGTKDVDLVKFGKQSAGLEGNFFFEKREQKIGVFFSDGKRKAFLNGVAKPYPTNLIGRFRVVLFSPVQLSLITRGPDSRRRFLDAAVCQLKPTYTAPLSGYNQALKQRNALLRGAEQCADYQFFEAWDEKLASLGSLIIYERLKYLELLKKESQKIYREISGGSEVLDVSYICSTFRGDFEQVSTADIKKEFLYKLEKNRYRDIHTGFTSCGPHKDELEIFVDGKPARYFGSQGQQRSAALCLKLAEAAVLENSIGEPPVVLLDDVMSELDDYRKSYMTHKIRGKQVFITNCESASSKKFQNVKLFMVEKGKVFETK